MLSHVLDGGWLEICFEKVQLYRLKIVMVIETFEDVSTRNIYWIRSEVIWRIDDSRLFPATYTLITIF